ncbi:related to Kinesin-like protein CIN8 [Saccharomycodes ludwigii]|uniref:Related to Kinesin-like protein CIN8 n=1 Tax=Saccharomycodes ludwigii TaxID=36035 RepID=A0A376B5K4_9ASCO|nr:hypothetical protein SCDLUD_000948 [Saccharomycodes ludwigii]KAH3903322.1 hypothetical protein SCDLUD_000948 [Saccharomycodes ludwigii]SSD59921.1 related to Kinesin-like protein CIN8 [Saccharomycodes ludwigii]
MSIKQIDTNINSNKNEEELNILVAVRCRSRNKREVEAKSPVVVTVPDIMGKNEVIINTSGDIGIAAQLTSKKYLVDKVFGPSADQNLIFQEIANPLFTEFVKGYNCTVLVYGMTSTGKTYTMTGDENLRNGELVDEAGIIPRILFKLFDHLKSDQQNSDFIVKCSFIELYNEELKDLLAYPISTTISDSNVKKLKIFDSNPKNSRNHTYKAKRYVHNTDAANNTMKRKSFTRSTPSISNSRRSSLSRISSRNSSSLSFQDNNATTNGTRERNNDTGIYIQNLQEFEISSAQQGIRLLQRGLKLRQVASTKMNDFSSRSHTIFTILLYKKTNDRDEMYRISKMNLVDLAGSENINKSGAQNQRIKEAGSINQSLLTLGRVINSLADKNPHVPFRESKLTRLLQDSLGGNTKTALIATISPAQMNFDETSSTLEYATKAKNIKNKPEMGELLLKDILVKNLATELSKLKADLYNTKNKEGIYLESENYDELMRDYENSKTEVIEAKRLIKYLKSQNEEYLKEKQKFIGKLELQKKKILELNTVIDYIYEKMDKQHKNEENLVDHAKQLAEAITLMQDTVNYYNEDKRNSKNRIKEILDNTLWEIQGNIDQYLSRIQDILETNIGTHEVEEVIVSSADRPRNTTTLIESIKKDVMETFQKIKSKNVQEIQNVVDTQVDVSTKDLDDITSHIENLKQVTAKQICNITTGLSEISEYCNEFRYILNEDLFNVDCEAVISPLLLTTYTHLTEDSNELLASMKKLMEDHLQNSKTMLMDSLKHITTDLVASENKALNPTRLKLDETIEKINHSDSLNNKFEINFKNSITCIQETLQKNKTTNAEFKNLVKIQLDSLDKECAKLSDAKEGSRFFSGLNELSSSQDMMKLELKSNLGHYQSIRKNIKDMGDSLEKLIENNDNKNKENESTLDKILKHIEYKQLKPVGSTGKTPLRPMVPIENGISHASVNQPGETTIIKRHNNTAQSPTILRKRTHILDDDVKSDIVEESEMGILNKRNKVIE